ncbi:UDP-glucuronosyl and UDP-glucosyl transferase [Handroanthus impetiginosus]|uniref:Glycosyltransferase n=1 Tax=Handroanthus impetiginosus TaxID=429701 RepID=A0A2G9HDL6_9LAMI|nr:UDP-glucuronosyl and UDP-glucosyl transferase [Handroanthus impetiginosus]
MGENNLKIVMYPWFGMGHLTTFLHISNKLAERGHQIFFFVPTKTQSKLDQFNLHPDLIKFISITVPHVDGLPHGTETTADVPFPLYSLLRRAMDLTAPTIGAYLQYLKPHFVFFDFTHWLPGMARKLGIKSVLYFIISPATVGYLFRDESNVDAYKEPPAGFPPSAVKLHTHEARAVDMINNIEEFGSGMKYVERMIMAAEECDAMGFKSCREIEGKYLEFLEKKFKKPVILAGPVLPDAPTSTLDEKWAQWLNKFQPKSVIFCAFGSEARLKKEQFQELVLGFELTGLPFLAALKPPLETETVEEALPEGFKERTAKRGVVHGDWVQQQLILSHPSVGCFVTHCGWGSFSEAMVNDCQLVLMPHVGDQLINARLMGGDLRVGVEVEKGDEDGLFTKEGVAKAIRLAMEGDSKIGEEVRANRGKLKEFFMRKGLEKSYVDEFVHKLKCLLE